MARELVTDELWGVIESLQPEEPPKPNGGSHASMTGQLSLAYCLSSRAAYPGRCWLKRWDVALG
jgi:hypothetical protein